MCILREEALRAQSHILLVDEYTQTVAMLTRSNRIRSDILIKLHLADHLHRGRVHLCAAFYHLSK